MVPTTGKRIELRNKHPYLTSGPTRTAYQPGSLAHIPFSVCSFACEVGYKVTTFL